jgi:hypothetical protein
MLSEFKVMLVVMLFYSFCITLITYAMPAEGINYVNTFSDISTQTNLENVSTTIQNTVTDQTRIPIIEMGALVFYSGNIVVDLLLNFAFAIPEIIGLVINGIMLLLNIDSYIFAVVQLFSTVVMVVLYFVSILQFIMGARTQGGVV